MTTFDDELAKRAQRARDVALFRYALVRQAADPGLSKRDRGELVRQLASVEPRPAANPSPALTTIALTTVAAAGCCTRSGADPPPGRPPPHNPESPAGRPTPDVPAVASAPQK